MRRTAIARQILHLEKPGRLRAAPRARAGCAARAHCGPAVGSEQRNRLGAIEVKFFLNSARTRRESASPAAECHRRAHAAPAAGALTTLSRKYRSLRKRPARTSASRPCWSPHDPDVDRDVLGAPTRLSFGIRDRSSFAWVGIGMSGHRPGQSATVAQLDRAPSHLRGVGERALLMPEQTRSSSSVSWNDEQLTSMRVRCRGRCNSGWRAPPLLARPALARDQHQVACS